MTQKWFCDKQRLSVRQSFDYFTVSDNLIVRARLLLLAALLTTLCFQCCALMVRDWSLIMGRGGVAYKMGKSRVRNFLR